MRNKLFQQAIDEASDESRQKVRNYTDMIDMAIEFGEWIKDSYYAKTMNNTHQWMWFDTTKRYDLIDLTRKGIETHLITTEELFQIYLNQK